MAPDLAAREALQTMLRDVSAQSESHVRTPRAVKCADEKTSEQSGTGVVRCRSETADSEDVLGSLLYSELGRRLCGSGASDLTLMSVAPACITDFYSDRRHGVLDLRRTRSVLRYTVSC